MMSIEPTNPNRMVKQFNDQVHIAAILTQEGVLNMTSENNYPNSRGNEKVRNGGSVTMD
jgi:hypothetical protein